MHLTVKCISFAVLWHVALTSFPAYAQSHLSGDDVRKLIVGNTVESQRPNGSNFLAFFDPSGKWIRHEGGRTTEGTWRINDDGTQCVWVGRDQSCALIQKNDDGTYIRMENGKPQFRWLKISTGKAF